MIAMMMDYDHAEVHDHDDNADKNCADHTHGNVKTPVMMTMMVMFDIEEEDNDQWLIDE